MAATEIRSVVAGSAGSHIKGFNSHGVVAVRNREVASGDVERVVDAARAVALPTDQEVLHVLPQEFIVDDQDGIREPVGMAGVRLEARVHIVTGAVSAGQNLIKCCNRAGLHVRDLLAGPLAAAEAVLTPEERELGVALVDLGGGTIDVVVYQAGTIRHTAVLPVGGGHVTVRVSDRGQGIPAGDRLHVFEPFFHGRDGRKGSGLGLAICRGFVEANGGRIRLLADTGEGTAFAVSLPLVQQPAPAP